MGLLLQSVHTLSPVLAGALIASVWQGLLLTAAAALALGVLRDLSPAVRMWAWAAVLFMLLALPVVACFAPHPAVSADAGVHIAEGWSVALLALWAACVLFRGVSLAANAVRLWRLAARATPVQAEAPVAALLLGRRRAVLCVSPEVNRPSVTGLLRPRILLPAGLLETLSAAELEHVLLHEMEHLRRGDDWLNLLQQVSLVLFPLNPALLWLDRQLCRERELACDDGVLRATRARKAYAACLVKLAEDSLLRTGLALALSALGTRARESELVRRVRRILAGPERVVSRGSHSLAVGTLCTAVLGVTMLVAHSPEWVSFDGGTTAMAQQGGAPVSAAAIGSVATAGFLHPQDGPPLAVLTSAVVSEPVRASARPVAVTAVRRRVQLSRPAQRKLPAAGGSWRVMQIKATTGNRSGFAALAPVGQRQTLPGARVIITGFETSQPVYAAVPWRDGWLIVQL